MIGQVRNQQEAVCRMARLKKGQRYLAIYHRPFERVVFEPTLNPPVMLLESLFVLTGRPAQEGFAQYGPKLYEEARPGGEVQLDGRHQRFVTMVGDGVLNAELMVSKAEGLHHLVSDSTCFSSVQEFLARKHGLQVGHFFHVVDDVSGLDKPDCAGNPYEEGTASAYAICEPSMMQHLGMFLDEGMALGMRDRFLGRVANPVVETLRCLFSKGEDKVEQAWHAISQGDPNADWVMATINYLQNSNKA